MKKAVLFALVAMMMAGSLQALAQVDSIQADVVEGKLDASEMDLMLKDIKAQIQELRNMQNDLASVEDSNGMIKALGQTADIAEMDLKEVTTKDDLEMARQLNKTLKEETQRLKSLNK